MYFQVVKPIFVFLFLLMVLKTGAQPLPLPLRHLREYYYTGGKSLLKNDVNCFVISTHKELKKILGVINRTDSPDFSKEVVLVVMMKQTSWNATVSINRCIKAGGFIEAYCTIDEGRHTMTYKIYPIDICIIPKYPGIHRIDFYNEWKMKPLGSQPVK